MGEFHQIAVPQLGEGIHHVKVIQILKEIGEWVDEDSDLIEIETDKATYEVPAPAAGYVSNILCETGQKLSVGEIMLEIGEKISEVKETNNGHVFKQQRKGEQLKAKTSMSKSSEMQLPARQIEFVERLQDSQNIVVPATIEKQIGWDQISEIRKLYRQSGEFSEVPSAFEVISYAVAKAMFNFEKFRAKLHHNSKIEINEDSHIGLAISLPDDVLVTPAVSVTRVSSRETVFSSIRKTIKECRSNPQTLSQYHSLTISSMAAQGITSARPVVVYPATATLFIGAPYYALGKDGKPQRVSNFILTFDHRIINGAYAAKFLFQVEKNIQNILSKKTEKA